VRHRGTKPFFLEIMKPPSSVTRTVPDPDTGNGVDPVIGASDSVVGVVVHDACRGGVVVVLEGADVAGVVDVVVGAAVVVGAEVVLVVLVLVVGVVVGVAGVVDVVASEVVEALAAIHEKTTCPST
jgi:hypothetical protein